MAMGKRLLVAAIASLSVTAAIAIVLLLFGDFGETELRILGTTLAISLYSLLSLPGAILLERRDAQPLGWATIAFAAAGFVLVLVVIWGADDSETAWKLAGTTTAIAAALTQISAMTTRRRDDDPPLVRGVFLAAVAVVALLDVLTIVAIWKEIGSEGFYRGLGAVAVLDVFLILLQPLLRRLRGGGTSSARAILEGTPEQIDDALRRVEGSGVRVRR
jgi:hypothetical protein